MASNDLLFVGHSKTPFFTAIEAGTKAIQPGWPTLAGASLATALIEDERKIAVGLLVSPHLSVVDIDTKTIDTGWPTPVGRVYSIAVSPDGTRLAIGHQASPYYSVIDVATRTVESGWPAMPTHTGVSSYASRLCWSPDGSRLVLGSTEPAVLRVIDVATKTVESGWPTVSSGIRDSPVFSPDGSRLFVPLQGDPYFLVVDVATKTVESGWPTLPSQSDANIAISPSGDRVVFSYWTDPYLQIVDVNTKTVETGWAPLEGSGLDNRPYWIGFSANGDRLLVGSRNYPLDLAASRLTVYDVATKSIEAGWPSFNDNIDIPYGLDWLSNAEAYESAAGPATITVDVMPLGQRQAAGTSSVDVDAQASSSGATGRSGSSSATVGVTSTTSGVLRVDIEISIDVSVAASGVADYPAAGEQPRISFLRDTFDGGLDQAKWNLTSSGVRTTSGFARIRCDGNFNTLGAETYDGSYSSLFARVILPMSGGGARTSMTIRAQDSDSEVSILERDGDLFAIRSLNGVVSEHLIGAYDPIAHGWWQISEDNGQAYFATSADGITWVTHHQLQHAMNLYQASVQFRTGQTGTVIRDRFAYIDNVNTSPLTTGLSSEPAEFLTDGFDVDTSDLPTVDSSIWEVVGGTAALETGSLVLDGDLHVRTQRTYLLEQSSVFWNITHGVDRLDIAYVDGVAGFYIDGANLKAINYQNGGTIQDITPYDQTNHRFLRMSAEGVVDAGSATSDEPIYHNGGSVNVAAGVMTISGGFAATFDSPLPGVNSGQVLLETSSNGVDWTQIHAEPYAGTLQPAKIGIQTALIEVV